MWHRKGKGWEIAFSLKYLHLVWGPPNLLFSGYQSSFLGVKRLECKADHSPPSSAEVKNEWRCTLTPTTLSSWCAQKPSAFFFYRWLILVGLHKTHNLHEVNFISFLKYRQDRCDLHTELIKPRTWLKRKVKLSLCTPCKGVKVQFHIAIPLTLASCTNHFTPGARGSGTHWVRAGLWNVSWFAVADAAVSLRRWHWIVCTYLLFPSDRQFSSSRVGWADTRLLVKLEIFM